MDFLVCTVQQTRRWSIHMSFLLESIGKISEVIPRASLAGSRFFRLDECIKNIVKSIRRYHVLTHADTTFLQVFLWGRFGKLFLKPTQFDLIEMTEVEIDGEIIEKPD